MDATQENSLVFKAHSGIHTLQVVQTLPISLDEAWDFFSSPMNLAKITPDYMGFEITSGQPKAMFAGQIISYKVAPFPYVKLNWVTEITHVQEKRFFVDEQRFGPYALWHHEHHFQPAGPSAVIMEDRVSYKLPLGPVGNLFGAKLVEKNLRNIFGYRVQTLKEMFNA